MSRSKPLDLQVKDQIALRNREKLLAEVQADDNHKWATGQEDAADKAEREKRAAIIKSEGELAAAQNLTQAAHQMAAEPGALHIRTLQTIRDISQDPSEKIVIFLPSTGGLGDTSNVLTDSLVKTIKP